MDKAVDVLTSELLLKTVATLIKLFTVSPTDKYRATRLPGKNVYNMIYVVPSGT